MNKSESIGNLCKALAAVQSELAPAKFDATNPFLKNRYATLNSVFDACRSLLAANGLSVSQIPGTPAVEYGPSIALTTVLMHTSGEWLSDTMIMPLTKPDPQSAGSALTYARRYALSAMIGIVADDDDDGNQAQRPPAKQAKKAAPKPTPKATAPGDNQPAAKTTNGNGRQLNEHEHKVYMTPTSFFQAACDWIGIDTLDNAKKYMKQIGHTAIDKTPDGRVKQLRELRNYVLEGALPEQDPLFNDEPEPQPDTAYSD